MAYFDHNERNQQSGACLLPVTRKNNWRGPKCNNRKRATMIEYLKTWLELKTDRRAVTALEYGVIAGVLAVVVVTAFTTLGTGLNNAFTNVSKQL
jgi:pilus assembly protein Flp/PilA